MNSEHSLNEAQKTAVETLNGPLLVLAGAGSGKTRVVTSRIVNLLNAGIHPSHILGLTFTNKAANEMKERVRKLTDNNVLICTFHSLGARMLRESIHHLGYERNFVIYDEDDIDKVLKACATTLGLPKLELREAREWISKLKSNSIEAIDHTAPPYLTELYTHYQASLKSYNAVDYDDLLALPLRLLREHPPMLRYYQSRWSHLLIDEYQDTNAVQYALVNLLVANHRNLCVVGDPDQSIYSWRGANIQNILNFERDYKGATVVQLEQNYRSRSNILNAANAVIALNGNRYEKRLWSNLGEGSKITLYRSDTDRTEAAFVSDRVYYHHQMQKIPLSQMVVFYRTNAQSRIFEDYLLHRRIPYVIVGGMSFYQRREIKDILAWLRIAQSETDYISFARTINLPKRGLGETTLDKICHGAAEANLPILSYCQKLLSGELTLKLSAKQQEGLKAYVGIVRDLQTIMHTGTLSDLVQAAIINTAYREYLQEDPETARDRLENLSSLVNKAVEWEATETPSLEAFLEELALKSSLDEASTEQDCLNLMTIHNGKGLEFTVTFLTGMEEDLFPHANSRDSASALEEERRLCYVGMTRAREYLYLSHANTRAMWGTVRMQRPSRFLREIPAQYVERVARY